YPVHGKGRVWRVRAKPGSRAAIRRDPEPTPAAVRLQALLGPKPPETPPEALLALLEDADPFLVGAAISALGRSGASGDLLRKASSESPKVRVGILGALRRTGDK